MLDGVVRVRVSGRLGGYRVSPHQLLPDGIGVEFCAPPAVPRELGLDEDQYMGGTGLALPEGLKNIQIEETRRV